MSSTGKLLRIFGAAILLIAVQFASVAAEAHAGHSHGPDGHSIHAHGLQRRRRGRHRARDSSDETARRSWPRQPKPAAQAETTVQNAQGAPSGSGACVIGCCGTGMGCCGAALAAVSPNLPPESVLASDRLCTRSFPFGKWTPEACANPLDLSPE